MQRLSVILIVTGLIFLQFLKINAQSDISILAENEKATAMLNTIILQNDFSAIVLSDNNNVVLNELYANGFIEAAIDSVVQDNNVFIYYFYLGNQYVWERLAASQEVIIALEHSGVRTSGFKGDEFDYKRVITIFENVVTYFENHGYPFVTTRLDSIKIDENKVSAFLAVDKGAYYEIDTVFFNNEDIVSRDFMLKTIDIKPGDAYSEKKIKEIKKRINNLEFLRMGDGFAVHFDTSKSWIDLSVKKRKSNSFDGVIGFYSDDKTGKIAFSGNINLKLMNSFKTGETLKFNWIRPQAGNQTLDLFYSQPYFFTTHFGGDYIFQLYRQDSSFTNVLNKPVIAYRFSSEDYISIYGSHFLSQISPFYADTNKRGFSTLSFGIGFSSNKLDYKLNPRKGYRVSFDTEAGKKVIKDDIDSGIESVSTKAMMHLQGELFIPVFGKSAFRIANQSAAILNDNIFENELFRIGGFKTLRGFDEEAIKASAFSIMDFEYRLLIQQNSNLSIFYNIAFTERNITDGYANIIYQGFGAGLSFDTGAGILSLYYAVGYQTGNPIVFRNSKIHFGYSARF